MALNPSIGLAAIAKQKDRDTPRNRPYLYARPYGRLPVRRVPLHRHH